MDWFFLILYIVLAGVALVLVFFVGFIVYILRNYLDVVCRIFEEKPIFIIPRGEPVAGAEDVPFLSADGLKLVGSYIKCRTPARRGVILFGVEYGSSRWSCVPYCDHLLDGGFDVFTFDFRSQGESEVHKKYEPLQWVTNHEIEDMRAATAYLKSRPDADPNGIGLFGISRGGGAGLFVASTEQSVRCVATDGAFPTVNTMIPYMLKWVTLYETRFKWNRLIPPWVFGVIAILVLRKVGKRRGCRFPSMTRAMPKIAPRALLMIHGGADSYIKPDTARKLFDWAGPPKDFWIVDGARHNQSLNVQKEEYCRRTLEFFERHLADKSG